MTSGHRQHAGDTMVTVAKLGNVRDCPLIPR